MNVIIINNVKGYILMKTLSLRPTKAVLRDTFENDYLERNKDICQFIQLLDAIEDDCTVAIDAQWGAGKTFFVKHSQLVLEALNPQCEMPDDERRIIKAICSKNGIKTEDAQPQVAVYYDAWTHDAEEEPVLSLIYEIMLQLGIEKDFRDSSDKVDVVASIFDCFTGQNIEKIYKAISDREDPLSSIKESMRIDYLIREFFCNILPERGNRLVIFVDELDRCKPSFAVKTLERIKHYFDIEYITFVFAINTKELSQTIKRYYGTDFSADKYLDRFFDLRVMLPKPNMYNYYNYLGMGNSQSSLDRICVDISRYFQFEMREIERFYRICRIALYKLTQRSAMMFKEGTPFCNLAIAPLLIGLSMSDSKRFQDTISGCDGSALYEFLLQNEYGKRICEKYLLPQGVEKDDSNNEKLLKENLEKYYHLLFAKDLSEIGDVEIGNISVDRYQKERLLRVVSLLSASAMIEKEENNGEQNS